VAAATTFVRKTSTKLAHCRLIIDRPMSEVRFGTSLGSSLMLARDATMSMMFGYVFLGRLCAAEVALAENSARSHFVFGK
jgi:hypothetical protein